MPDSVKIDAEDIGILVLAAGRGRRFGADKRLARLPGGEPLLQATLKGVPPVFRRRLLVLRPDDNELAAQARTAGWDICVADAADGGMGHSLAAGMAAATAAGWQGCLVALGDMPYLRPETYLALREALCRYPLVVPRHGGQRGNPVGFQRRWFGELTRARGDRGARRLLAQAGEQLHWVDTGDSGVLRDVDRPENLEQPLASAGPDEDGKNADKTE